MMNRFTVEEINLMCIFGTESRTKMLSDIKRVMPYIQDSDMVELSEQVLSRLETMTDEEFAEVVLEAAE
jgi:hypothetical protein